MSAPFPVHNGERQGAVCSPVLFCFYLDELLSPYANDLTLLVPAASAIRVMLRVCEENTIE